MFTRLLDNKSEEITLSLLSIIFFIYLAALFPFLILEMILALEIAVMAVSEPDKNPEIKIRIRIIINSMKLNIVII